MKKRFMALVLAMVLLLGLGVGVYADPNEGDVPDVIVPIEFLM